MRKRYVYTNQDVINYRKNQYRLFVWSNLLSYGYIAAFFLWLNRQEKKTDPLLETPTE